MPKNIIVIGTLDTKGQEIAFVRDLIAKRGHLPVVIDSGIQGEPAIEAAITRHEVAAAAATSIEDLLHLATRTTRSAQWPEA